jgi:Spy/CpxP family protein refolding chaperone
MMDYGNIHDEAGLLSNVQPKLTAEQIDRIRCREEGYTRDMVQLRELLSAKGRELKDEWLQTAPDRGRIEILHGEVTKLQGRIRERASDYRTEILDILTPEQQTLVEEAEPGRDLHQERVRFRSKRERR